jgi:aldehyde:ferredoxin oxidoreductase
LFGYHGRYLRIDLSAGRAHLVELDEPVLRAFIGGVGLGTWLLAREVPAQTDPLGERSALVIALSPLVGTPLTTSAKFAVVGLSPLTGRISDALSSSHFAIAGKRAGVDAIVVTGKCETPTVLFIDGQVSDKARVRFESAGTLWGRSARDAEEQIRAEHGSDWQVACIGPAGEAQIPFATISHDGRHAGRGGLGAVLGSKQVKAIAVRGHCRTRLFNPERTIARAKDLSARSFGPATEKYRALGTVANLLVFNRFEALPTRNFQASRFEGAEPLSAEALGPARRVARKSCAACTIGCEHIYALQSGGGARLEYESLYALGPLCGVSDPGQVVEAAAACDQAGLDTITTGGTIALLMECAERGLIDARVGRERRPLRFGDGAAVLEVIGATVRREGVGALLALGSRRAADQIGGEAPQLAAHVKGLELPGYDPRSLHTMALGLAVGTRGADHNRSGAYEADFSDRVDRRAGGPESARWAAEFEDRAALVDSMILCKFLRHVFNDLFAESAEMLRYVAGWDVSAHELRTVARRVVNARKCINQREGWTRAEDTLPPRLLSDGQATPGSPSLSSERLDAMIAAYYHERGWTEEGRVPIALRHQLGLADSAFGP